MCLSGLALMIYKLKGRTTSLSRTQRHWDPLLGSRSRKATLPRNKTKQTSPAARRVRRQSHDRKTRVRRRWCGPGGPTRTHRGVLVLLPPDLAFVLLLPMYYLGM